MKSDYTLFNIDSTVKAMKRNAQSKSAGGPLKRTGKSAELWDEALGRSLDHLPSTQLPTKRSVLQRYRCLRIERPDEPTVDLASYIAVHQMVSSVLICLSYKPISLD